MTQHLENVTPLLICALYIAMTSKGQRSRDQRMPLYAQFVLARKKTGRVPEPDTPLGLLYAQCRYDRIITALNAVLLAFGVSVKPPWSLLVLLAIGAIYISFGMAVRILTEDNSLATEMDWSTLYAVYGGVQAFMLIIAALIIASTWE